MKKYIYFNPLVSGVHWKVMFTSINFFRVKETTHTYAACKFLKFLQNSTGICLTAYKEGMW